MPFIEAKKEGSKARVALIGPAGSGKTWTMLELLTVLGCKKIAVEDTERGSAKKYSDKFKFSVNEPVDSDPRNYQKDILDAKTAGFDGLGLDSFSHLWNGKNGVLEKVDQMGGNKFSNGWKTYNPLVSSIVDDILKYPGHVVATMRSKTAYVVETVDGKAVPKKVGLEPIQRDGMEYEFDLVLQLSSGGEFVVSKQRGMPALEGLVASRKDLPTVYAELKKWLEIA